MKYKQECVTPELCQECGALLNAVYLVKTYKEDKDPKTKRIATICHICGYKRKGKR